MLNFSDGPFNKISFISTSTNSDCENDEEEENEDFVERTNDNLDQMKPDGEGLKQFSD